MVSEAKKRQDTCVLKVMLAVFFDLMGWCIMSWQHQGTLPAAHLTPSWWCTWLQWARDICQLPHDNTATHCPHLIETGVLVVQQSGQEWSPCHHHWKQCSFTCWMCQYTIWLSIEKSCVCCCCVWLHGPSPCLQLSHHEWFLAWKFLSKFYKWIRYVCWPPLHLVCIHCGFFKNKLAASLWCFQIILCLRQ